MNQNPGQKQLQEMMARAQKQMADQHQSNMHIAWHLKQQEDARGRASAAQSAKGSGQADASQQSGGYFLPDERFTHVEAEVARLKRRLGGRKLSQEEYDEQMKSLMVADDDGNWWMVGASSGAWYRFDGQNWIHSSPPGRWVQSSRAGRVQVGSGPTGRSRHRVRRIMLIILLVVLIVAAVLVLFS